MKLKFKMLCRLAKLRRINSIKLLQITLVLASLSCFSQWVYADQSATHETKIDFSKYLSASNRPVFYIRLFGNDFPVPTRFEYTPDTHSLAVTAEFRSPNLIFLKNFFSKAIVNNFTMQWIDIGSYKSYVKEVSKHPASGKDQIRKFNCYGFSVEVRTALTGIRAQAHQMVVLVHNGNEYIDFVGKNTNVLAKELLQLYGALNDIARGDDCKFAISESSG